MMVAPDRVEQSTRKGCRCEKTARCLLGDRFGFGFIGNILSALFLAICVTLGFGPDRWAEFLISGIPTLVTPGVVRLAFLLLASMTLIYMLWNSIIGNNIVRKSASIIAVCVPFVVGAFYIVAAPQPDRNLSEIDAQNLLRIFRPIANEFPNTIQVESVAASPDAGGYGAQFMAVFHIAGLTVNGIAPSDAHAAMFPSLAQVSSPRMRGLYIGVSPGAPPPERGIKFQKALSDAGFKAQLTGWQGVGPDNFVFVVSYR